MSGRGTLETSLAILLGSGMGPVADAFDADDGVSFDAIPGIGGTDVDGHRGEIRPCRVAGRRCDFVVGRKHHYEGNPNAVRRLVRHVHERGAKSLVSTHAAGSLDIGAAPGELMLVDSLLDFQFRGWGRPAVPPAQKAPIGAPRGQRSLILDGDLGGRIARAAGEAGVVLRRGTLASCHGPTYETPSEVSGLRSAGVSVVSMSGAPEVAAAHVFGMKVALIALVTNWAAGISNTPLRHEEVLSAGHQATEQLRRLIVQLIAE